MQVKTNCLYSKAYTYYLTYNILLPEDEENTIKMNYRVI